jgi:hypothetical protein
MLAVLAAQVVSDLNLHRVMRVVNYGYSPIDPPRGKLG